MPLFRREYRLVFGTSGEIGSEVTELQVQFNIVKTSDSTKNKATIKVFNLSKETRALLETSNDDDTNNPVILLQTQYGEDVTDANSIRGFQTLFTGQVIQAITSKTKDGDFITQIEAQDGYIPIREGVIAKNFPPGATRRTVLNALIAELGVPVGEIRDGGSLSDAFSNGVTVEGPIKLALDKLLDPVNIDWSIQDDSFVAIRKDLNSDESILDLTSNTGLIGSPQAKKGRSNKTTGSKNESEAGIKINTLLAPTLLPNRRVRITSRQYPNGQIFKTTRVRHKGDFRGNNWITEAELADVS